jgi:hypothetical protein
MYARPDDLCEDGISWRQVSLKYNDDPCSNPLRLYSAYQFYDNIAYGRLVDRFGLRNAYILSAGWGLIRADFLTPSYDITFSPEADACKRRRETDRRDRMALAEILSQLVVERANAVRLRGFGLGRHGRLHCDC